MKLAELDPDLFRFEERDGSTYLHKVQTVAEAHGVDFECPKCRGHHVMVTFRDRGVPDHLGTRSSDGTPTRWAASGAGVNDLTLSPSVDCTPSNPNCWHGFITNGEVT